MKEGEDFHGSLQTYNNFGFVPSVVVKTEKQNAGCTEKMEQMKRVITVQGALSIE